MTYGAGRERNLILRQQVLPARSRSGWVQCSRRVRCTTRPKTALCCIVEARSQIKSGRMRCNGARTSQRRSPGFRFTFPGVRAHRAREHRSGRKVVCHTIASIGTSICVAGSFVERTGAALSFTCVRSRKSRVESGLARRMPPRQS